MPINAGHFSNTMYDKCAYPEDLYESTAPYTYIMNTDRIHNCNGCLPTFGPRGSFLGAGVWLQTFSYNKKRVVRHLWFSDGRTFVFRSFVHVFCRCWCLPSFWKQKYNI